MTGLDLRMAGFLTVDESLYPKGSVEVEGLECRINARFNDVVLKSVVLDDAPRRLSANMRCVRESNKKSLSGTGLLPEQSSVGSMSRFRDGLSKKPG